MRTVVDVTIAVRREAVSMSQTTLDPIGGALASIFWTPDQIATLPQGRKARSACPGESPSDRCLERERWRDLAKAGGKSRAARPRSTKTPVQTPVQMQKLHGVASTPKG
jgi:hypothetical protein